MLSFGAPTREGRTAIVVLRGVVVMILAAAAWIVQNQVAPTSAHAACFGGGVPITDLWVNPAGQVYAREEARETCNGNGQYLGKVFDIFTDGSCVRAQYTDGGFTGVQGISCNSAGASYLFNDQTGNTSANYRVYVDYYTPSYISTFGY